MVSYFICSLMTDSRDLKLVVITIIIVQTKDQISVMSDSGLAATASSYYHMDKIVHLRGKLSFGNILNIILGPAAVSSLVH